MCDMPDGIVCSYVEGRADFRIVDRSVNLSSTVIVRCIYRFAILEVIYVVMMMERIRRDTGTQ